MSENCIKHLENYWKNLTLEGNQMFSKGKYSHALEHYLNALYRSEVLNNHIERCIKFNIPFVDLYVISCNNLANTYIEINDLENAHKMKKKAISFLLRMSYKKSVNTEEVFSTLRRAVLEYTHFVQQNNLEEDSQSQILNTIENSFMHNNKNSCQ